MENLKGRFLKWFIKNLSHVRVNVWRKKIKVARGGGKDSPEIL